MEIKDNEVNIYNVCKARSLKAIQSVCIRCQWDYTALIHLSYPAHPSFPTCFPPLPSLLSSDPLVFPC